MLNKTTAKVARTRPSKFPPPAATKLEMLEVLLKRRNGASIDEMTKVTSWQKHSVRGALAGALKTRGHAIGSSKVDGHRRYSIEDDR